MSLPSTKDSSEFVWSADGDYPFPQAGSVETRKLAALSSGFCAEAKRKKIQGQGKQNQVSVTAVSNSANNSLVLLCQGSLQPKGSCPLVLLISVAAAHGAHQVGS